ncbi:MAG: outer membrane protein assembly factor BamD [Alphaproteobacteria bacterium]|nr:outer membrane protein assembly factor BamD [Alphaproteobacteria bacterium]
MKKISLFIVNCSLLIALAACGGKALKPDQPLHEIYDEAYRLFDKKNYRDASEEFQNAERQFPASSFAPDALVMAAYSSYLNKDFADTLIITDRFMRFHPGHRDVPYVLYLRGMSYYRQVSDVRREPGMSVYALNTFQQLVERFPNSPYADNARNKILILKNYIAGKVMYSARRDMARQNWPSAIEQFQQIVTGAQETQMTPEALFRLTESYTAIGLPEQASGYAEMLRLNFPDNEWTKKLK